MEREKRQQINILRTQRPARRCIGGLEGEGAAEGEKKIGKEDECYLNMFRPCREKSFFPLSTVPRFCVFLFFFTGPVRMRKPALRDVTKGNSPSALALCSVTGLPNVWKIQQSVGFSRRLTARVSVGGCKQRAKHASLLRMFCSRPFHLSRSRLSL